ncbi:DegT/DnrJ/EryC1/StrS family aminotransferase [Mitsuaria sp. WAJ17]|uniref:aminotransferase class I/II-fold pyridoxal phosphate-dependent enzyme n=1 Tax=Mitsuaria sp. WAJ17 TaxID=2761452 RepID=UPI0015FEB929|nr:aminotransferase class I/II-fold pyridoxal phosphate-dependent enzyme [Mitsuaria sp. WAJ17]MBB2484210.1 DegT/DnrJ/EryC1/StrS family aminotransferase [Mitsuaria sp. WAJ17]
MKGHVTGALRWWDFLTATLQATLDSEASLLKFRTAFATSLGLDAARVTLFGSGRSALHALVAGLALPPDAEVLLPGYTCVVVPNVFLHLGLPVRYVDIAPGNWNPDAEAIAQAITPRTALVVLPHNFGLCMAGVEALRERFPAVVFVEDAAHAWGSRDAHGRMAGTRAQAAFFSFEYSKPLTTGIGGALVLNDLALRARLARRLPVLRVPRRGQVLRQVLTLAWHRLSQNLPGGALRALASLLRWPARVMGAVARTPDTELSGDSAPDYSLGLSPWPAALGLQQARRAEAVWALRRRQVEVYDTLLAGAPGWMLPRHGKGEVLLRYPVRIDDAAQRAAVMRGLLALDIVPGVWFDDVVHPAGSLRYGYEAGACPQGEAAARAVLNLPLGLHADLSPRQQQGLRALAQGRSA